MQNKLNVAILGSGNIGTDLLIKVLRSPYLKCTWFIGRNLSSPGMRKASSLGVNISDRSIDAIIDNPTCCDLVFDATTASYHKKNAPVFKNLGIKAIDMTPSQVGEMCVPSINLKDCLASLNVNMITCGGQTAIPVAYSISRVQSGIKYIEIVSSISSRSAGPGTRANIDEYVENSESGLSQMTGCQNVKAILNLNPAIPCIDSQSSIFVSVDHPNMDVITESVATMVKQMINYVPGYELIVPPLYENGRIAAMVKVRGLGDFLPQYAGNLDIINCAAITLAEAYAKEKLG